jgi:protocatechuate 3,4-dioxygenase beta subunit
VIIVAILGAQAAEQTALSGRVLDTAGRPLVGAAVAVLQLGGEGFRDTRLTDERGIYAFPELPDGEYSIEASLPGFVSSSAKPKVSRP